MKTDNAPVSLADRVSCIMICVLPAGIIYAGMYIPAFYLLTHPKSSALLLMLGSIFAGGLDSYVKNHIIPLHYPSLNRFADAARIFMYIAVLVTYIVAALRAGNEGGHGFLLMAICLEIITINVSGEALQRGKGDIVTTHASGKAHERRKGDTDV